jgi:hypothetical protein
VLKGVLVGKPEWKRPLGKPRRRWDGIATTISLKISWKGVDWTNLAQNRNRRRVIVNETINLQFP